MGLYINKGNAGFRRISNGEYVDKLGLIAVVNQTLFSHNFDGLKDCILQMLAGGRCWVDSTSFRNDLSEINSRDDVLTVLMLDYLQRNGR